MNEMGKDIGSLGWCTEVLSCRIAEIKYADTTCMQQCPHRKESRGQG